MTISRKAIADFLDRKLEDFTFLKQWTRKDLLEELRHLPARPRITSPYPHWHHQLVALLLCCIHDAFLLFLDMGSGKTRILLEAFAYRRRMGEASCMLAVALNDVNAYGWEDDAEVHAPQFRVQVLTGSKGKRWKDFEETDAHVYVTSYPGLLAMLSARVPNPKKKGKNKMVVDKKLVARLCSYVDFSVYDEIHKCKNHQSLTYSVLRQISRLVPFRYGATGTAFGKDPSDLWAVFYVIDKGETLGDTLGMFREAFFIEKTGYAGFSKWVFDTRQRDIFRKALRNRSIYYKDTEIGDMPKRRRRRMKLRPPAGLQEYYNKALESLQMAARNEELENNWIRLRMICSGFVSYKGEDSDRIQLELPHNPKIDAVESFAEGVPLDRKGIVVHEFVYSGLLIERKLKEMGHEYYVLNGRLSSAEKKRVYKKFRKEGGVRFLVMNWRSGGTGGNYQVAPYMHFYETPVSPIERKQCEGRIRRRSSGAKHRVYYSDSIIKDSVEEDILAGLKQGRDLYKELMSDGKKLRKLRKL